MLSPSGEQELAQQVVRCTFRVRLVVVMLMFACRAPDSSLSYFDCKKVF